MERDRSRRDSRDGSARFGAQRDNRRAARHVSQLLALRSTSSLDRNDTWARSEDSTPGDNRVSQTSGRCAFFDHRVPVFLETLCDGGILRSARASAGIDDDVDRRKQVLVLPERFPHQPLHAVAAHCVTHDARWNRQSKPRVRSSVGTHQDGEMIVGETARVTIDAIEFGSFPKTLCRFERSCGRLQAGWKLTQTRRARVS